MNIEHNTTPFLNPFLYIHPKYFYSVERLPAYSIQQLRDTVVWLSRRRISRAFEDETARREKGPFLRAEEIHSE